MKKYAVLKGVIGMEPPLSFLAQPEDNNKDKRRVFFRYGALFEEVGEVQKYDKTYIELSLVLGRGHAYHKSRSNSKLIANHDAFRFVIWVTKKEYNDHFVTGEEAGSLYTLWITSDITRRYLMKKETLGHVEWRNLNWTTLDFNQTLETGEVHLVINDYEGSHPLSSLTPYYEEPEQIWALCRRIEREFETKMDNSDEVRNGEGESHFTVKALDISSDIEGEMCIREEDIVKFSEELFALMKKYHVPMKELKLAVDTPEMIDNLSLDDQEIQTLLLDRGHDTVQVIRESRGAIHGSKFGI